MRRSSVPHQSPVKKYSGMLAFEHRQISKKQSAEPVRTKRLAKLSGRIRAERLSAVAWSRASSLAITAWRVELAPSNRKRIAWSLTTYT